MTASPISPVSWAMTSAGAFRAELTARAGNGAGPLCPAVRARAGSDRQRRQSGLHRGGGRSRNAGDPGAPWGSAMPPHVSGAIRGWHHGRIRAMRSAAGARASDQADAGDPEGAGRRRPIPMPPSPSSTAFSPACRRACSFSRCSWRGRNFWTCWRTVVGSAPRLAALSGAQSGHPGCAAGCGFSRAACRRAPSWTRASARRLTGSYEEMLDGGAPLRPRRDLPRRRADRGWRRPGRAGRPGAWPISPKR